MNGLMLPGSILEEIETLEDLKVDSENVEDEEPQKELMLI